MPNRRLAVAVLLASALPAAAEVLPFIETFESGINGYTVPTGVIGQGTEGDNAFLTVQTTLSSGGFGAITFAAANIANNPSGGAFAGDYLASGVTRISFDVRHNGPAPLSFFLRLATPNNFPGFVILNPVPVFAGQGFTTVSFDISATNPLNIPEGPVSIPGILSNVGNLQLLVGGPEELNGLPVNIDVDNLRIVPTPGAAGVLALGCVAAVRRRR